MKLFKRQFLGNRGNIHMVAPLLAVVVVGVVGTYLLVGSHADTVSSTTYTMPQSCDTNPPFSHTTEGRRANAVNLNNLLSAFVNKGSINQEDHIYTALNKNATILKTKAGTKGLLVSNNSDYAQLVSTMTTDFSAYNTQRVKDDTDNVTYYKAGHTLLGNICSGYAASTISPSNKAFHDASNTIKSNAKDTRTIRTAVQHDITQLRVMVAGYHAKK